MQPEGYRSARELRVPIFIHTGLSRRRYQSFVAPQNPAILRTKRPTLKDLVAHPLYGSCRSRIFDIGVEFLEPRGETAKVRLGILFKLRLYCGFIRKLNAFGT